MPDPNKDADQLRFAQIRSRMLEGLAANLPPDMVESAGAKTREEFRAKLCESESVVRIMEVCAWVSQTMEEERGRHRSRP
jgi:hypothetical protein